MTLLAIGINHQTAPVELRERVAFADHALPAALGALRELPSVTPLTRDVFDGATAERRLCDYFAVATMDGLSAMSRLEA